MRREQNERVRETAELCKLKWVFRREGGAVGTKKGGGRKKCKRSGNAPVTLCSVCAERTKSQLLGTW